MHDIDDDTWAVGRTQCCAHSIRPAAARKCRGTWRLVAADLLYEVAAGGAPRGPPPLPACGLAYWWVGAEWRGRQCGRMPTCRPGDG